MFTTPVSIQSIFRVTKGRKVNMSTFQGKYVEEIRDCVVAAAASGLHVQLLGEPGTGKTSIANAVAESIFGKDHYTMTRFNPTTPNAKVEGQINFSKLFAENVWEYVRDHTPYDPQVLLWIADEIYRSNTAVQDLLIDVLDRWDVAKDDAPIVVATANFLPKNERSDALLDRFACTMWVQPNGSVSAGAIVDAQLDAMGGSLLVPGVLPTYDDIKKVRAAHPSERAKEAVKAVEKDIETEVEKGLRDENDKTVRSFGKVNNRRRTYWAYLLFRTSVLYSGTEDFETVHPKAMEALRYGWTAKSEEEYNDWQKLMGAFSDPVASAIEYALKAAYTKMEEGKNAGKSFAELAIDLGRIVKDTCYGLSELVGTDDPRFKEAALSLQTTMAKYIRGVAQDGEEPK